MVVSGRLQQSQVDGEERRLEKAANKVRALVPSPNRLDEYRRGYAFPPAAETTPMRPADIMLEPAVERTMLWPGHYLSGAAGRKATYDVVCKANQDLARSLDLELDLRSASAMAMERLADLGAVIETQVKLATEDEHVLAEQIARYEAGKPTNLLEI